ncbi:WD40 repeat-like protein [Amanita rubescens]|nr:WD40 repeat-like protein [Amanita rubescens]
MAHSISIPPSFSTTSTPLRTSSLSEQAYVLSIVSLQTQYAASTSAPTNKIDIFDKSTLRRVQTLPGHEVATTALRSINRNHKKFLMSSGKDGQVIVWDDRTNSIGISMTNAGNHQPLLCFDVSSDGMTVAAGSELQNEDALIHFWDPRNASVPLRTHSSTHSDDITTLSFSSSATDKIVLSGSSDGLITLSNADEEDEDEAVLHVANWGCSISQAGWIPGEGGAKIWAASDMETFSTWTYELDPLLSVDIRQPSVHRHGQTWVTDYLITCHAEDTPSSSLGVFVGSNEGDAAVLTHPDLRHANSSWAIHKQWSNGHVGIVRALLWDNEHNVLVTGGEDTKINVWSGLGALDDGVMDADITYSPRSMKRDMDWEAEEQEGKRARK